jgi:hypothetical protein
MDRGLYIFLWRRERGSPVTDRIFIYKRIILAVRRVQLISDRMSYIILRGRWCNIIVPNVHAPCEDKYNDVNNSFYEKLGRVLNQFPSNDTKILLDFNANVCREDIIKRQSGTTFHTKLVLIMELSSKLCK